MPAGSSKTFEPKESITINYNRWNASIVELLFNGKTIALPSVPLTPADKDRINFTIIEGQCKPDINERTNIGRGPAGNG